MGRIGRVCGHLSLRALPCSSGGKFDYALASLPRTKQPESTLHEFIEAPRIFWQSAPGFPTDSDAIKIRSLHRVQDEQEAASATRAAVTASRMARW